MLLAHSQGPGACLRIQQSADRVRPVQCTRDVEGAAWQRRAPLGSRRPQGTSSGTLGSRKKKLGTSSSVPISDSGAEGCGVTRSQAGRSSKSASRHAAARQRPPAWSHRSVQHRYLDRHAGEARRRGPFGHQDASVEEGGLTASACRGARLRVPSCRNADRPSTAHDRATPGDPLARPGESRSFQRGDCLSPRSCQRFPLESLDRC